MVEINRSEGGDENAGGRYDIGCIETTTHPYFQHDKINLCFFEDEESGECEKLEGRKLSLMLGIRLDNLSSSSLVQILRNMLVPNDDRVLDRDKMGTVEPANHERRVTVAED
jgi:hypothetical protein